MKPTPKFAHVVYQTSQIDTLSDWYCTVLDAHVVFAGKGMSFLTYDDEHHRIALLQLPDLEPRSDNAAQVNHVAFTFDSLEGLLDRYRTLAQKGIQPFMPVQHGVTTSLYYKDPDGNLIEMQVDNFTTPEEATAYMKDEEYTNDPTGTLYRPELMLEALRKGVPVDVLTTRTWAKETSPELPHPMDV